MEQLLGILIDNASKYTPEGGQLKVDARPVGDNQFVQVCIEDNGIGIAEDEHHRLLTQRYFRSSDPVVRNQLGNGVSLYIARHIVQAHGGRFWFESEHGKGSTFHFTLPIT